MITADLPETAAAASLDPGVVIAVTATVVDDRIGTVTSRDVVHINPDGPDVLTTSPFWTPA